MIIKNAKVFSVKNGFVEKDIYVADERITDDMAKASADGVVLDVAGLKAIPGLVDIHFHGAVGHDFCDAYEDGLQAIADYEAKSGVLAICPATMTYSEEILGRVMDVAKNHSNKKGADLVGINMEGPFISPDKLGAQNPEYLMKPDVDMFRRLQERSGGLIKLVDIAPEVDGAMGFIKECCGEVNISLAHNNSDYDTAVLAFENGARHMTHLFNAMPGINHRNPGPVIAALENGAEVEIISDGIHIHPAMLRFVFNSFSKDKVILIADSMEATGLPDGSYQLGGQKVTVKGNLATLSDNEGVIAGSVTNLFDCMKFAIKEAGISEEQAIAAATLNPAKAIGVDKDYGSLDAGRYANIVVVDDELNIVNIIRHGHIE